MAIRDLGDGKFKIDLRIGGRKGPRLRKIVEDLDEEQVKEAARDLRRQARAMAPMVSGPTLKDGFIHAYAVRWQGKRGERSVNQDYGVLTRHIAPETPLSRIGSKEIMGAIAAMRAEGVKDQTINHKLSILRVIYKEGMKTKPPMVTSAPSIPLLTATKKLIRKPLTWEQEAEFLAYFAKRHADPAKHPREGEKWRLMIDLDMFLADTGCRLGEALRVIERDVNLKENRVDIWENKADKPRSQPMTPRVKAMIVRRMAGRWQSAKRQARLFDGKAKKTIQQAFKEARDDLGYGPETVVHSLRHSTATRLIEAGEDVRVVKEYMGHKRIETTMSYAHVSEKLIKGAGAKLAGAPEVEVVDAPKRAKVST